jgi:hypothetical protein
LADFVPARDHFSSHLPYALRTWETPPVNWRTRSPPPPGPAPSLEVTNRSSLDDKSVREVRSALEAELHVEGVHTAKAEQAMGTVEVVLSESLREYVWTAEIVIGSDEKKVALVSLPRSPTGTPFAAALPIVLKANASVRARTADARCRPDRNARRISPARARRRRSRSIAIKERIPRDRREFQSEDGNSKLPCPSRTRALSPRFARTPAAAPRSPVRRLPARNVLPIQRRRAAYARLQRHRRSLAPDAEDGSVRAFFAAARNFFTGALSPGIGKISNVPSFYSAAALPRASYTLWAFAAVDGSLHLVDGMTDQAIRGASGAAIWPRFTPVAGRAHSCWSRKAAMQSATACARSRFPIAIRWPSVQR